MDRMSAVRKQRGDTHRQKEGPKTKSHPKVAFCDGVADAFGGQWMPYMPE